MSTKTIETMINWVEDNIMDNPSLIDLSNHVGYSSFYCSSKFHENIGITFKQYISKRRLSLAATEVREEKTKLLDIAIKYGYSSQEAFTRAFVEAFGVTPSKYRKQSIPLNLYMKPDFFKS